MAVAWEQMRQRLLDRVFYSFEEDEVDASQDLLGDGYLDSLSVLVTLGIFDEELGEGVAVKAARVPDTTSMDALKNLYQRLRDGDASAH
ncbi:hypothetical protein [Mycobacterium deserti]|uniref:Carrier domain-containing protein n=1 Tax=Mycobacterium deserti TaxID=2978347 RepID=A0ABT2MG13_9MYCO|nr:hypothetical protein [Mycobacterium deserti]MCT7660911.1 hypothetical protein [Mycobacterium deserti]